MLPLVEWLVVLREVFSGAQTMDGETTKEKPRHLNQVAGFWRRPTLARPVAVLPSGLQRFTSVFGMGTGGTTALLSPEIRAGLALEPHWRFRCVRSDASADADLWRRRAIEVNCPYLNFSKNMLDR